ncbi:MAG TPA: ADP-ribosylation factor-like protein [Terriglobales bacterium]|nr:ADP-ribosylation factor-like protein [Terriglobales bacterium]
MVSINYAFREICCKIVYYGPGLSGKTTNLIYIHKKAPPQTKGELISLATDADRTLYFDFLPIDIGPVQGFATKFQLYTVPGQVYYNATRKLVLRGVDGLVFVADSQAAKLEENIESMNNLIENLEEYGYVLEELPMVIQYNKRDLEEVSSLEELEKCLNPRGLPYFEAEAVKGIGVFDTLKAISKLVLEKARGKSEPEEKKELVSVSAVSKPSAVPSIEREEQEKRLYTPSKEAQSEAPLPKDSFEEVERDLGQPVEMQRLEEMEKSREKEREEEARGSTRLQKEKEEELVKARMKEQEDRARKIREEAEKKKLFMEKLEREMAEIERQKKAFELEKIKEAEELKKKEQKELMEKMKKMEEEKKTLIPSQAGMEKEAGEVERVSKEAVSEKSAEGAKEQTIPPFQSRVIISPMLKQKKTKPAEGGFLWRWIQKFAGRR